MAAKAKQKIAQQARIKAAESNINNIIYTLKCCLHNNNRRVPSEKKKMYTIYFYGIAARFQFQQSGISIEFILYNPTIDLEAARKWRTIELASSF
jgi:hypothetical protein